MCVLGREEKAEKAEPTEVVLEVDRRVRELLNSGGILYGFRSCMVAVVKRGQEGTVTCPVSELLVAFSHPQHPQIFSIGFL